MSGETKAAIINGKFTVFAATIGGICTIVGAVIGVLWDTDSKRKEYPRDTVFNIYETDEYISLQEEYETLESQYTIAVQENSDLQNKIDLLNNKISTYSSLNNENKLLKDENNKLKEKLIDLEEFLNVKILYVQAKADSVYIYNAPNYDSDIMTAINKGDKLQIIDITYDINKNSWYKININNIIGFISYEDVDVISE